MLSRSVIEGLVADIEQEEMLKQTTPMSNPPAWQLGHLAVCTDFALELMGRQKQLPPEWFEEFGPGSMPLSVGNPYPCKEKLMAALRTGHELVGEASKSLTEEQLAGPNPYDNAILKKALPTFGDLMTHLMTTHEAAHLGHLSEWRRQMGREPMF